MRIFPYIPTAQDQEAPLSLLRRAAVGNGYTSLLALIHSVSPRINYTKSILGYIARNPTLFQEICKQIGINDSCRAAVSYQRVGKGREDPINWLHLIAGVGDLQFHEERICVPCYLEKGYTLAQWDHIAAYGCAEHGVLLDTSCPVCKQAFSYDRTPLGCGCDHTEVISHVRPLPNDYTDLLSLVISSRNQSHLELVTSLHRLLDWWEILGLVLTQSDRAEFLNLLTRGHWPEILRKNATDQIHPNIVLYPILTTKGEIKHEEIKTLLTTAPNSFPMNIKELRINQAAVQSILRISKTRLIKFVNEDLLSKCDNNNYILSEVNLLLISSPWLPFYPDKLKSWHALGSGEKPTSLSYAIRNKLEYASVKHTINSHNQDSSGIHIEDHSTEWTTISETANRLKTNTESVRRLIKCGLIKATKGTPKSAVQWRIASQELDEFSQVYVFASEIAREAGLPITTTSSRLRSIGIMPVSGPGIDSGLTYLFLRSALTSLSLDKDLSGDYQSPAGRKQKAACVAHDDTISSKELGIILGVKTHDIRLIVRDRWIVGQRNSQGSYIFRRQEANDLKLDIHTNFVELGTAANSLGQSLPAFRRIWLISEYVSVYRFGRRSLLKRTDHGNLKSIWDKYTTSANIARELGRQRTFCLNLEKMGLLQPSITFGLGARRVKLFPRSHPIYECYRK